MLLSFLVGFGEVATGFLLASLISATTGSGAITSFGLPFPKPIESILQLLSGTASLGALCAIALLVTNSLAIGLYRIKSRLLYEGLHQLRAVLVNYFFQRDFVYYSKSHSSSAISMLTTETTRIYHGFLSPLCNLFQFLPTVVVLVGSVFWVNPWAGVFACAVFLPAYGLYFYFLQPAFQKGGSILHESTKSRHKILQEGFGAIRELFFWNKRSLFINDFIRVDRAASDVETRSFFLACIPRNSLEICIVFFIGAGVLFLGDRFQIQISVAQLIFLGFTALRLLPALQMTFLAFVGFEIGRTGLAVLSQSLEESSVLECPDSAESRPSFLPISSEPQRLIELKNVTYSYGTGRNPALQDVSFSIPVGSFVGFVGSTGAGKSTAVDILAGLLIPQSGGLWVDGRLLTATELVSWRKHLAYLPQHFYLLDASVEENIALGSTDSRVCLERVEEAARAAHIHDFIKTLPKGYREPMGERGVRLSGGQRQRLGLARALYSRAPVVLLDEPTSALDPITEAGILDTIVELKGRHTIVLITHRETAWKRCDRIFRFTAGRVEPVVPSHREKDVIALRRKFDP